MAQTAVISQRELVQTQSVVSHQKGANIDQALILAAELGHVNGVETLMALGADVNSRDVDGETALIRSSENGHDTLCSIPNSRRR